jgi:hypothetical protein
VNTVVEQTEDQANDVAAALLAHARHQGEHAYSPWCRTVRRATGALGAERPGQIGPFGRWPDPREEEGHDESHEEDPAPKVTRNLFVTWFAARQQRPLFARPDA